jgi:hypothetical protein
MAKLLFKIRRFFWFLWRVPDSKKIPKPYRMERIGIKTAWAAACALAAEKRAEGAPDEK